ncbi:hypothetical protein [Sphingobium baderi]|uniref:hypothetical protein n=1 Tax=Sphingobium baderi TaxID=1332080 RepID=UPI0011E063C6|nr:hypothetical protein [Sphingobium baderi]
MKDVPPLLRLIELPGIAEVEKLASARGGLWREDDPERVALTDRVSVSLFGITEDDTYRPEPVFTDFLTPADRIEFARYQFVSVDRFPYARKAHDKATDAWYAWEAQFNILYDESIADEDRAKFWQVLGIDGTDERGSQLCCFHAFSRQLIVVARGLLPGATMTPDASGRRASPDADTWGQAMAAAAKAFQERKRA